MANSVDQDQTAPIGAVCSGPTLFASILNLSVMLGNYLQQTAFGTLRVNSATSPAFSTEQTYLSYFEKKKSNTLMTLLKNCF